MLRILTTHLHTRKGAQGGGGLVYYLNVGRALQVCAFVRIHQIAYVKHVWFCGGFAC